MRSVSQRFEPGAASRSETRTTTRTLVVTSKLFTMTILAALVFAPPRSVHGQSGGGSPAYMGTGSCSSSNCHGGAAPRNTTSVLQNEYVTWHKHDRHAQAWLVLTNEEGKRIGKLLGIAEPEKDKWCLACHATPLTPTSRTGVNFSVQDGVGCEACHGAAENYLGPHTARDATHAKNIEHGMLDIVDPSKRTSLCLQCHYGTEAAQVNHRLIGAGHPRLSFELDTFGMIQPKHWDVDDDYRSRKGDYHPARAWLVGQIRHSLETLEALESKIMSKMGAWPELTLYHCYACHHSLAEEQWKTREYGGRPGEPRLNTASMVMVKASLGAWAPQQEEKLGRAIAALHDADREGRAASAVGGVRQVMKELADQAQRVELDGGVLTALARRMASFGANAGATQYETAEQVAMSISALASARGVSGETPEIKAIYDALAKPETFEPGPFNAACARYLETLG